MTEITVADAGEHAAWSQDWQGRLRAWFAGFGAARSAEQLIRGWQTATEQTLGHLVVEGEVIGHVAVCVPQRQDRDDPVGTVVDIWVSPQHRRRGHGRAARKF